MYILFLMNDLHLYYFVCLDLCPIHKCVSFIETYDEDNIAYHLPESVNPDQILKTVQPKFSETAEQKSEMSVIVKMKGSLHLHQKY
jgi:hypothetical protein